jgi:tetraacyldisaccharide 4'-kinase
MADRRASAATMVERLWWGRGAGARLARAALLPAEGLYAAAIAVRGALYGARLLPSYDLELPTVSVGNLSVGGTGKTPVAAWIADQLQEHGARPAVILRGYGSDEPLVHSTLNPDVPVVVSPDRVRGVTRARLIGADIAVLDDAFQHRRARRSADVVLLSADRWSSRRRLLPAGPWREPLRALRRASLVVVTRKAASPLDADRVVQAVSRIAPAVPVAIAHLVPDALRAGIGTATRPLESLRGARVHAIAAIGDPTSFVHQLEAVGATVMPALFPDHHDFTAAEAESLALAGARADITVCTLKDAVKLAHLWPRAAPPLWYVSQRVVLERGGEAFAALRDALLRARTHPVTSPASAGSPSQPHGH